jgi:putative membrane protein
MRLLSLASAAAIACAVAACGQPSQANKAVDPSPTEDGGVAAGANSYTEGQARGAIESAGYTNPTGLTLTADGVWTGTATKNGASVPVSVDYRGSVTEGSGAVTATGGAEDPSDRGGADATRGSDQTGRQ